MTLAELVRPGVVKHPALLLGRLLPKIDDLKRGEAVGQAFRQAVSDRPSLQHAGRAAARLQRLAVDLEQDGVPVVSFTASCATRLITGSGAGLPEVNATIVHPVYGYPYLPGSSLKGAARAEALRVEHPDLVAIFGGSPESDKEPGLISFLDAVPTATQQPLLELDVATVHHKRYYEGSGRRGEPDPTESPVPLPFLVVRAGAEFRFLLAAASPGTPERILASAFELLYDAMTEEGLGAATASGYGYLDAGSVTVDVGQALIGGA